MAGKHIYIETILDNLLGGFQTTFDKMIAAINRMTGHTDEDEGKSLVNVVDGLNEMTEKLDDQIDELQALVAASSSAITKLIVTQGTGTTQIVDKTSAEKTGSSPGSQIDLGKCFDFKSHANGVMTIHINIIAKYTTNGSYDGKYIYKIYDKDNNIIFTSDTITVPRGTTQFITYNADATFFVKEDQMYYLKLFAQGGNNSNFPGYMDAFIKIVDTQFNIVNLIQSGALDFMEA